MACACLAVLVTKCLVLGAGGRPPDEGGGSEDTVVDSDCSSYQTPAQSPDEQLEQTPQTDMFLPLGPGQWPDQLGAPASHASFCIF